MYRLIIKENAIKMAAEAYEWYEERRPGLGDQFLQELDGCYSKIESVPEHYAKIRGNFRQINLTTFPYVIVFKIYKSPN